MTGAALADAACEVTDVVVAGSPGMTVDDLRELHLEQSHFFSEQAPGDAIAELGVFGAAPSSPTFGGTRMSTNAPDHPTVAAHSQLLRAGLRGAREHGRCRHGRVLGHRPAPFGTSPRSPVASWPGPCACPPCRSAWPGVTTGAPVSACSPTGAGWSTSAASETGNLVCEVLDEGERALLWVAHRVGAIPTAAASTAGSRAGGDRGAIPRRPVRAAGDGEAVEAGHGLVGPPVARPTRDGRPGSHLRQPISPSVRAGRVRHDRQPDSSVSNWGATARYVCPVPVWLSEQEYATLRAACAQMLPSDQGTPGAEEAGVADYIDGFLGAFTVRPAPHLGRGSDLGAQGR